MVAKKLKYLKQIAKETQLNVTTSISTMIHETVILHHKYLLEVIKNVYNEFDKHKSIIITHITENNKKKFKRADS